MAAYEIANRDYEIAELKAEKTKLKAGIAALKAKFNANSRNNSKPPFSDGSWGVLCPFAVGM